MRLTALSGRVSLKLLLSWEQDNNVNVIVIRAEGRGFCAGVDIKELAADSSKIVAVNKGNYDTFVADSPQP